MTDKPNIVYLLADQIRACSLPVYGDTQIETPHIDRLAQEGTVFSNAIATAPVCTPYRSMMLTGRHPQTTGHLINFVRTRHDEIGLGDVFSRNGYRTAWVGKWHLH
ncbi:MAG: sulfatase-like hydrolase/transferase, partial [Candidatus Poribacteria bacterium]|nr:sulfatase-like hydrolase/transferase [Candidatus Poribacteria bacterium]